MIFDSCHHVPLIVLQLFGEGLASFLNNDNLPSIKLARCELKYPLEITALIFFPLGLDAIKALKNGSCHHNSLAYSQGPVIIPEFSASFALEREK